MKYKPKEQGQRVSRCGLVYTLVITALLLQGCISLTEFGYRSFIRDLDGKNELVISTYPAWYGRKTFSIPFIYKEMETHRKLYLQLVVRDLKKGAGKNENVESIQIQSLSYQLGKSPKVELISNYDHYFWMQGNSRYDKQPAPAIPYRPDLDLVVEIALTLNGERYAFKGEMPPYTSKRYLPLILELYR